MDKIKKQKNGFPLWIKIVMALCLITFIYTGYLIYGYEEPIISGETTTNTNVDYSVTYKRDLPKDFKYGIISDESDNTNSKTVLNILINQKLNKEQLENISLNIFNSSTKREKSYLYYFLSELQVGKGAWATASNNPMVKVQILGSTSQQDSLTSEVTRKFNNQVIGKWRSTNSIGQDYIIYKKGNKQFISSVFYTGLTEGEELKVAGRKLRPIKNVAGEYYVINKLGDLDIHNEDGSIIATAYKI